MVFRHEYRDGVWVDLEQPTIDEVRAIAEEFNISERLSRELHSPTPLPLVCAEDQSVLLVLHFPSQGDEDGETKNQELDFIVGKHFVITVRYEIIAPIHHLKKLLEAQELVSGKATITTEVLLDVLFAHIFTAMRDHTNQVADSLARVEKQMFDGKEGTTVRSISNISRSFLHLEAALANLEDSIEHFLEKLIECGTFGPAFPERSQRILAERSHLSRLVKTHRAAATELRETNIALLETRQNEIMKTLTIVNFIFLPLGLISWIFAMRTEGIPYIDSPYSFWIVLGIMFGVAGLLTAFFIRKRWI